jgi:glycosyltransferase involved in cell wall biosynthesis
MTIAIYTVGLNDANARLMPWRTVTEVARHWQEQGLAVRVFSGGLGTGETNLGGVNVINVRKPGIGETGTAFDRILAEYGVERLYFPVAPSPVNRWVRAMPQRTGVRLVWYMPGAWYGWRQMLVASRHLAWRSVLPYWRQALWPKRIWTRHLLASGDTPLIAMTSFTADRLVAAGYPRRLVHVIPPGKDAEACPAGVAERFAALAPALAGEPFFLFFGPPNPIRGVVQLISAFQRFAAASTAGRLVCLFRADSNVDSGPVRRLVERAGLQDRLLALWESVGAADLHAFLQHCRAVVKPFLLVPSEIPLAVIEAAQHGKPVFGFGPDGTAAFIDCFGLTARHGDVEGLTSAMLSMMTDDELYAEKCREARAVYERHPTWDQVGQQWLDVSHPHTKP